MTSTYKVQLTLTPQEFQNLSYKGGQLGYNVTRFIKFLIGQQAYSISEEIPTFPMSKKLERKTVKALNDYSKGKSKLLYEI